MSHYLSKPCLSKPCRILLWPLALAAMIGCSSGSSGSVAVTPSEPETPADPGSPVIPTILAQTPNIIDEGGDFSLGREGDGDDPAIYIHPTSPDLSFFIATLKEGGMAVYDLNGFELQFISPFYDAPNRGRFNNVDLRYDFLLGGERIDIAVATERNNNTIRIFQIDPNARQLIDITDPSIGTEFFPDFRIGNPDGESYGLAMYKSPVSGLFYVFVNSNERGDVAQLELFDTGSGTIGARRVRTFVLPTQCEGMVADDELGVLYVGEEEFGIRKFDAEPTGGSNFTIVDQVQPSGSVLEADVEGLTIYYGPNGQGYLLASSQGDSTFAVYERGGTNAYLGSFSIPGNEGFDGVEESDGADVINVGLGSRFGQGLFVTHDGSNQPEVLVEDDGELENVNTNFKLIPWQTIANSFDPPLLVDPSSFNPRN